MAMLAEVRSKQKWSEDPRNTKWSNDKERYGYQMLEKMGWANGNGLGRKQNGETSHVKIKKRKNNLGLGAKESHDQDWIAHQEDFNNLLSALHQHGGNAELRNEEQNKKAMLEVAKASRKRVFYKKFIRSKDTSRYSDKDMACIFGSTQSAPATPQNLSDEEVQSDDSSTSCPVVPGESSSKSEFVTYTSKDNIHEYFARRMKELKDRKPNGTDEGNETGGNEIKKIGEGPDDGKGFGGSEVKFEKAENVFKKEKKKRKKSKREIEIVKCEKMENCVEVEAIKKKSKKRKLEKLDKVLNEEQETEVDVCTERKKRKKGKVERTEELSIGENGKCSGIVENGENGKGDEFVKSSDMIGPKKKKNSKPNKTRETEVITNGEILDLKEETGKHCSSLQIEDKVKREKNKKKKAKK